MEVTPGQVPLHRRTCYFSGRVHGVGFRYTVHNLALGLNVRGFVRNLPDGRVEVVMEGPDQEMDRLIQAVTQKMQYYIENSTIDQTPASGEFQRFSIRH